MLDDSLYKAIIVEVDPPSFRAKIRVPSRNGGSKSVLRVVDNSLIWARSLVQLSGVDIGKVVYVGYEGGSTSDPIIIGKMWTSAYELTRDSVFLDGKVYYTKSLGTPPKYEEDNSIVLGEPVPENKYYEALDNRSIKWSITYMNGATDHISNLVPNSYIEGVGVKSLPIVPDKDNSRFSGWYNDVNLITPVSSISISESGAKILYSRYSFLLDAQKMTKYGDEDIRYTSTDSFIQLLSRDVTLVGTIEGVEGYSNFEVDASVLTYVSINTGEQFWYLIDIDESIIWIIRPGERDDINVGLYACLEYDISRDEHVEGQETWVLYGEGNLSKVKISIDNVIDKNFYPFRILSQSYNNFAIIKNPVKDSNGNYIDPTGSTTYLVTIYFSSNGKTYTVPTTVGDIDIDGVSMLVVRVTEGDAYWGLEFIFGLDGVPFDNNVKLDPNKCTLFGFGNRIFNNSDCTILSIVPEIQ